MGTVLLLLNLVDPSAMARTWTVKAGATPKVSVRVDTNVGDVSIVGSAGEEVTAIVTFQGGSDADRAKWDVKVESKPGEAEIQVCCGPCAKERPVCARALNVSVQVTVPSMSTLQADSFNSPIRVRGVEGAVKVVSPYGRIEASGTSQSVDILNVDGGVALSPRKMGPSKIVSLKGSIRIALPPRADAHLTAKSLGGRITGFKTQPGVDSTAQLDKTLGKGSADVDVSTTLGSIAFVTH
jgi:hypothetical protein